MTKQTKMILGVGVVAIAGYLLWKQSKMKGFANAVGRSSAQPKQECKCSKKGGMIASLDDGTKIYECCGTGMFAYGKGKEVATCPADGGKC